MDLENTSNKQPVSDEPTEEEVFDYFLGRSAPEQSRRISLYLKSNPTKASELREWSELESCFKNFPVTEPQETVLESVRTRARAEIVPQTQGFFAQVRLVLTRRRLALTFCLFAVVGLNYVLGELRQQSPEKNGVAVHETGSTAISAARLEKMADAKTENTLPQAAEQESQAILGDYATAMTLYQQGRFEEAQQGFSSLMVQYPAFEKRRELYAYWIETLKKLGKYELAEKKQELLEDIIQAETAGE